MLISVSAVSGFLLTKLLPELVGMGGLPVWRWRDQRVYLGYKFTRGESTEHSGMPQSTFCCAAQPLAHELNGIQDQGQPQP